MKRISSKRIKKVVFGIMLSDGYVDKNNRFDLYTKHLEYAENVKNVLSQITGVECNIYRKVDKRFSPFAIGYRLYTNSHPYFRKIREIFYGEDGKKHLTRYIANRLDFEALAHAWMCDGYMYHAKNRKKNKVQNLGYYCLEGFPKNELEIFIERLNSLGISARLERVDWGFGYRPKISSISLQKFIDEIFEFIIPVFKYKTRLYYKSNKYVDSKLQSAEQFVFIYDTVDDIVRHSQQ